MIGGLALSFGAPLVLAGLLALPVIWWLLKMTPPRPQTEAFPPLRILQRVLKSEETPSKSPWWLTLIRLLLAALVIFALAAPTLNPRQTQLSGDGPLALLVDNGWASGGDWQKRREAAEALIREAGDAGRPVALAFSAEGPSDDASPVEATVALQRLAAAGPRPIPTDRAAAAERLATALSGVRPGSLAFLSDGIDGAGTQAAARSLAALQPAQAIVYRPEIGGLVGLTAADNSTEALVLDAVRPTGGNGAVGLTVRAVDAQGREVGTAPLTFGPGDSKATRALRDPGRAAQRHRPAGGRAGLERRRGAARRRQLPPPPRRARLGRILRSRAAAALAALLHLAGRCSPSPTWCGRRAPTLPNRSRR